MLTERQQEVLEYLYESRNVAGLLPSTREIQEHFGFASQTAAVDVLRALERKGVLRCLPGVVRGIILNEPALASSKVVCIPLHGVIAAGYANDSVELDGDYVIHDSARTPKHNDIVAALIDGETALKRLMVQGTQRWLKAENPRFPNLIAANSLQVQGVMRALIRGHEARRESMDE